LNLPPVLRPQPGHPQGSVVVPERHERGKPRHHHLLHHLVARHDHLVHHLVARHYHLVKSLHCASCGWRQKQRQVGWRRRHSSKVEVQRRKAQRRGGAGDRRVIVAHILLFPCTVQCVYASSRTHYEFASSRTHYEFA